MKKYIIFSALVVFVIALTSYTYIQNNANNIDIDASTPVSKVLDILGDQDPSHIVKPGMEGISVERGENIVVNGFSINKDGVRTARQSKHFVCTSCHNIKKDEPDLRYSNPQTRLEYAAENDLPFLQGTSLYGAVNRTSFYNDDYYKKYGDLVDDARNSLREAIQLCAVECSQGRPLKSWEMESVLAYLWTIELKMGDLSLSDEDWQKIKSEISDESKHSELLAFIKSYYLSGSPATFADAPKNRRKGYKEITTKNADNGKLVYDLSCKHCHENSRYSFFELDDSKLTFRYLNNQMHKYNDNSLYHLTRYGTKPLNGKKAYMPNYTLEKLSHQQMEDLRAYIEKMSL